MKNNKNEVSVTRQTVSSIKVGKNTYDITKLDGGVNISDGAKGNLFVPNGALGKALANEILALTHVVVPRKRRTKAEIQAANAGAGDSTQA